MHEALYLEAARRCMTVNDLLGELIGQELGVPYRPQEALKIT